MGKPEYKYTKDGKKVVVIGKLNNEQWIVQEIYVSEGKEFPAGENFVETTLLDEPAETYVSRQIKNQEARYEEIKKQIEIMEKEAKVIRRKKDTAKLINEATEKYQNIDFDQLDQLFAFMAGEITHLIIKRYGDYKVLSFIEGIEATDRWHGRISSEGLKLISLFGCDDYGQRWEKDRTFSLNYRINEYRDGSGSWTTVYPCTSLEDVACKLDELISDEDATKKYIELKKKYNLANPTKAKIKEYHDRCIKSKKESVKDAKKVLKEREKELSEAEQAKPK